MEGGSRSHSTGCAASPVPLAGNTSTVLMFTISSRPYRLSSRPIPLCFTPPNGMRGSDFTAPLTNTIPDSISRASSSARARSFVQMLAPRPNSESFASAIAEYAHRFGHVAKEGGLKIPALPAATFSANLDLRAFCHRVLHLAFDLIALVLADEGSHVGRRIERIADAKSPHSLRELREELIDRGIHDEETFGGDARLSAVDEPSRDRAVRRCI